MPRHGRAESPQDPLGPEAWVLSRSAIRRVDRLAVERYGIPSIVLMENAAIGLRERALDMLADLDSRAAVVICGPGNNGGDGFALARHLHNEGCDVTVLVAGDPGAYTGDAAANLRTLLAMGMVPARLGASAGAEILEHAAHQEPALLIDALLGTGLRDAARGPIRDTILQINRLRAPGLRVLAVDVPSGLDCDTGEPAGAGVAVEADATVTFAALKPGFLRLEAQRWTGEVTVAGIGAPIELIAELGEPVEDARRGLAARQRGAEPPEPPGEPPHSHARRGGR